MSRDSHRVHTQFNFGAVGCWIGFMGLCMLPGVLLGCSRNGLSVGMLDILKVCDIDCPHLQLL